MVVLDSLYKCWTSVVPSISIHRDEVAEAFVSDIVRIHELLVKRGRNLEPCAIVNELFEELIDLCVQILPEQTTRNVGPPEVAFGYLNSSY